MKPETIKKLDGIAKACVAGLEAEIAYGLASPAMVREIRAKTKNPTRLEVIKAMIRADLKAARARGAGFSGMSRAVSNAMKSSEQANYLANAIDARIKRRAWTDSSFDSVYRRLFEVGPRRVRQEGLTFPDA